MNAIKKDIVKKDKQRGTVLIIALIILISITVISLSAINSGVMSLRIAGNEESIVNAFQTAQATLDFTVSDTSNLPMLGPLNQASPITPTGNAFTVTSPDYINTSATRIADCQNPPRARNASSLIAFSAFHFDINTEVEKTNSGMGRSAMSLGYILLGPKC